MATGNLDLRPDSHAVQITHDAQGRADAVLYLDADGNLQRQRPGWCASPATRSKRRGCCCSRRQPLFPDGLANSSGQVGRNYMRHTTGSVYAPFEKPVHMYRGETMAGIIADEARHDPPAASPAATTWRRCRWAVPFLAAFVDPGAWGPASPR